MDGNNGSGDLVTIRPDGTERRKVTHQAGDSGLFAPAWARDGRSVYATLGSHLEGGSLVRIDLGTGTVTEVHDRLGNTPLAGYVRLGLTRGPG